MTLNFEELIFNRSKNEKHYIESLCGNYEM